MFSEDQLMNTYNPIEMGGEGSYMLETAQAAIEFAESRGLTSNHVWAIMESGEDNALTRKPWESGLEEGVWMEDDFDTGLFERRRATLRFFAVGSLR